MLVTVTSRANGIRSEKVNTGTPSSSLRRETCGDREEHQQTQAGLKMQLRPSSDTPRAPRLSFRNTCPKRSFRSQELTCTEPPGRSGSPRPRPGTSSRPRPDPRIWSSQIPSFPCFHRPAPVGTKRDLRRRNADEYDCTCVCWLGVNTRIRTVKDEDLAEDLAIAIKRCSHGDICAKTHRSIRNSGLKINLQTQRPLQDWS
ncbi:hypothetical protein SKAU_G00154830 [Synaphobranchus kaupii]|uniref:Uncharacterized protein n=1 Tax=Synaphobranchus kaupii TaxID=118154 RepID=A0A9Q1FHB8_SYNKA|nr:hypothetical protein SKAU_G00154830 [Synaphobranchus kaupii]